MRKYNYFLSVFLIIIGFSGIYMASNFETRSGNSGDPGAAFWPILLCCGLILCSVILLIQTILESKKATEKEDPLIDYRSAGVHCVFLIFVIMIAYAVIMNYFGFVPATLLFVIATMLAMGERRPVWIGLTTVGITGFIYVVFTVIMGVILPQGKFF